MYKKISILTILMLFACNNGKIKYIANHSVESEDANNLSHVSPEIARPNQEILIFGHGFENSSEVYMGGNSIEVLVRRPGVIKARVPSKASEGLYSLSVTFPKKENHLEGLSVYVSFKKPQVPFSSISKDLICSDVLFRGTNGLMAYGQRNCSEESLSLKEENGKESFIPEVKKVDEHLGLSKALSEKGLPPARLLSACNNIGDLNSYDIGPAFLGDSSSVSDTMQTSRPHGIEDGQAIRIGLGDNSKSAGLSDKETYYALNVTEKTLQFSSSQGGNLALDLNDDVKNMAVYRINDGTLGHIDAIDDFNKNKGRPGARAFLNARSCAEIEANSSILEDLTPGGCFQTSSNECLYGDRISKLQWTKTIANESSWPSAMASCESLVYQNQNDWRLPTQNELMEAYIHGFSVHFSNAWMHSNTAETLFWTSTPYSLKEFEAWAGNLSMGKMMPMDISSAFATVCVR